MTTRWCEGPCGRQLPATVEFFALNRNASPGGFSMRRTCRMCWRFKVRQERGTARGKAIRRKQSRRHYERHAEAIRARQRRYWHEVRGPRLAAAARRSA